MLEKGISKWLFITVDPEIAAKAIIAFLETLGFEIDVHIKKKGSSNFSESRSIIIDGLLAARQN